MDSGLAAAPTGDGVIDLETGECGPLLLYTQGFQFDGGGTFDPVTGHLFGLDSASRLYEFDPVTRDVLGVTDLDELIRYLSQVPGSREP